MVCLRETSLQGLGGILKCQEKPCKFNFVPRFDEMDEAKRSDSTVAFLQNQLLRGKRERSNGRICLKKFGTAEE